MRKKAQNRFPAILGVAALGALGIGGAQARDQGNYAQAEWAQDYASPAGMQVQRETVPILSPQTVTSTEQMVERYKDIVARGGWRQVSGADHLRIGSRGPAVAAIRQRLIVTGDLDPAAGGSGVYDSYVAAGVKRFQARHGLSQTGAMTMATQQAMNVPADVRLRQLEINVVRLRSYSGDLGRRFVITNIPAALVETVENGQVVTLHAAGVGKIDRQSPIMNTKATQINFNPTWTVPASIVKKDLIPKMQKDPNYLTDNKIRILSNGSEVSPKSVNWFSDEGTRYTYRQDSGADFNSMGIVRINIPNPYGVFMHDTNTKGVFGDDFRFISSGCVRVQNVREYITWLLKDTPGWDRQKVEEAIESGKRIDANISQPVPVYWTYITAWSTPDGIVQFRDDIYKRDGVNVPSTIGAPTPVASAEPMPQTFEPGDEE
ncbi:MULTISPECIES: L,D-transpeptidase family protein [Methylobacterium]|uniref:L,D-transpeptidase family protein n=2 Tax=Methylobacteriaceae TaxID=119045 RepID=UPI0003669C62|nr:MULTISPECIES: L,D-transpeptidase family protein [Methylobacterium]MBN4096950.1 L,D-transpeptidase family protein [Methylobacterium sp. OT2]UIN36047.1 L,D-transpeptidase family protein [Methylobacterium oryzae]SEF77006.1 Putative peptidoglycan binding domain-containing protein [Methylobacterium sp. 190mf]SEH39375.1 Putative peptidoglycan binding domain-containing protein [Methylobacterium sp. 275MFSha3.1]SEM86640.1 Putative peptidoglycan binding domain-containing protein [Methylobacterium sp